MKEDIIKIGAEKAGTELFKNINVHISLEGWPCTVAVIGLGIVYIITTKIKYDAQEKQFDNADTERMTKVA